MLIITIYCKAWGKKYLIKDSMKKQLKEENVNNNISEILDFFYIIIKNQEHHPTTNKTLKYLSKLKITSLNWKMN